MSQSLDKRVRDYVDLILELKKASVVASLEDSVEMAQILGFDHVTVEQFDLYKELIGRMIYHKVSEEERLFMWLFVKDLEGIDYNWEQYRREIQMYVSKFNDRSVSVNKPHIEGAIFEDLLHFEPILRSLNKEVVLSTVPKVTTRWEANLEKIKGTTPMEKFETILLLFKGGIYVDIQDVSEYFFKRGMPMTEKRLQEYREILEVMESGSPGTLWNDQEINFIRLYEEDLEEIFNVKGRTTYAVSREIAKILNRTATSVSEKRKKIQLNK